MPARCHAILSQAIGGDCVVRAFFGAAALVCADRHTHIPIAAAAGVVAGPGAAARAHLAMRVDAVGRLEGIGENLIVAGALQGCVGLVFVFRDNELLGAMQAGHEQVADRESFIAASQDIDIDPPDFRQLGGRFLLGRRVGSNRIVERREEQQRTKQ